MQDTPMYMEKAKEGREGSMMYFSLGQLVLSKQCAFYFLGENPDYFKDAYNKSNNNI